MTARLAVIIPALNEEPSIGAVLEGLPADLAADVIVVDNGSTDRTAEIAAAHGARVVREPQRGYGVACLAGLAALRDPEVVAFLDADLSDEPARLSELVQPLFEGRADFVIGSRMLGTRGPGALPLHSRFGNWLAGRILTHLYGQPTTDLGPLRALRYAALQQLHMQDRGFGWTMEMQAKAARLRLRTLDIRYPIGSAWGARRSRGLSAPRSSRASSSSLRRFGCGVGGRKGSNRAREQWSSSGRGRSNHGGMLMSSDERPGRGEGGDSGAGLSTANVAYPGSETAPAMRGARVSPRRHLFHCQSSRL